MDYGIIKKSNLPDIVMEKVKSAIRRGELKAGERLPSHDELCQRWGISRTSIREALNRLEILGILTKQQGRGTFIQETTQEQVMPRTDLGKMHSQEGVLELLEARKHLETAVAGLAAVKRTDEDLARLKEYLQVMEQAEENTDHFKFAEADQQFHLLISRMSGNSFLESMMLNIREALGTQQMEVFAVHAEEHRRISAENQAHHREIFAAIERQDSESASNSMFNHLRAVEEFMKRTL